MNSTTTTTTVDFPIREPRNVQELADLIQNTITQIEEKVGQTSNSILTKIDDMGRRIDDLERNIAHVISQTNAELP